MQWENLTAPDFGRAVREVKGVCILALGVLERHGDHLPLGTDFLNAHRIACLAAQKEPAIVFPPFYFGQIYEARCFPGTVTLRPTLLVELLQAVLEEIGRNGLEKIIIYNGHGGNNHLLRFLAQSALWEEKPFTIYIPQDRLTPERQEIWQRTRDTVEGGHACEVETSITLANYPGLVRMDSVPQAPGTAQGRLGHLPPTFTGIWWYADYPEHYAGDARTASPEKGRVFRELIVDTLAEYIAAVKRDEVAPALQGEFFAKTREVAATTEG